MKCWGANVSDVLPVALLYETRDLSDHVREALATLRTSIVYEAPAHEFDRAALEQSGASVVFVNLDAQDEADLENIYSLLDDERYRVVFNDGEVSSALTGWDHARWVRHLGTKIFDGADIDPPRPTGAQPVPMPTIAAVEEVAVRAPEDENAWTFAAVPEEAVVMPQAAVDTASVDPVDAPVAPDAIEAFDASDLIDFDSLMDMPAMGPPPLASIPPVPSGAFDSFDIDEFDDLDFSVGAASIATGLEHDPVDSPAQAFAVTAPQAVATDMSGNSSVFGGFDLELVPADDFDFDEEQQAEFAPPPSIPASPYVARTHVELPPVEELAPLEWSVDDLQNASSPLPSVPETIAHPTIFGIEKLRPEEFLAPVADADSAHALGPFSRSSLELMPLDEAVAPTAIEAVAEEDWLDPDSLRAPKAKIRRVWVLGASIGGPEAVREFLAGLPRDYPALFVLAQHLGEEFVEMMARQLAQATPLNVRVPAHGERAGHGDVLIAPTHQRLLVDRQGVVVLERNTATTPFNPSIDRVLRDVADRFGADAGAIIFSGMSTDAAEGCRHLVDEGGSVYTQRPDTCVVSTMIDGVMAQGMVSFSGSPQELAQKLVADSA